MPFPLRLAILGSTGSIGRSTLEVVDAHPDKLVVVALAAARNADLLRAQVARYRPSLVSLDEEIDREWRPAGIERYTGAAGLRAAALHPDADIVVVATS